MDGTKDQQIPKKTMRQQSKLLHILLYQMLFCNGCMRNKQQSAVLCFV